jgi:WD40 repeat protein/serine/threonine protein kinase
MADLSGRTLGGFVLREPIGEGGYSVVYRCEQPLLKRDAVIKVLHERRRRNDLARERFLREARLASRLKHPYAAHVYAFGVEQDDGLLWIAMELVEGMTLGDWLRERGPMPLEQFVPFFECIARVVQAAHERGIVHRDLKPSNVMVIEREDGLYPKLLDFGIAKVNDDASLKPETWPDGSLAEADEPAGAPDADGVVTARIRATPQRVQRTRTSPGPTNSSPANGHLTSPGAWIGSRPYMSPEQWGDPCAVGPASDIYSLGIVAYEALTGRVPFTGASSDEYYRRHLHAEVPPLGGDFSADLDRIIRRALAKSPEDRHGNGLELAAELRAALRADPREQLRSLTRQWRERDRSPDLLSRGQVLADLERCARSTGKAALSELECSYLADSQRRARRVVWVQRWLVALAVMGVFGVFQYRAVLRTRMADQIATESEVEQGRQALLHGESNQAVRHLAQAYQRGDRSSGVAFMLARALQPRMSELGRFTSSSGRMWSAMFAPDGKRILTTDDKSARMWDAESNQLLFTMSHGDTVYQAVFSPDGSRIITAGGDGTVRIWNAATGGPIRALTDQRSGAKQWRYYAVAMSSHFVAAIDTMGRAAHVWDAETGTQIAELTNDASESASLALSPDGHWLATSGGDDVRVFDTSTWRQVVTIAGPRVRSLSFGPSGRYLAVGTYDGIASIWEIPSGARVRCLREAGESVDAIAFSRDGMLVATGSRDGTEQVWDARSGGLRTQFNSHHDKIYAVEFSPTGSLMLSAGADGAVVISNFATGMPVARLEGPTGLVFVAHFDQASRRIVGASWDGTARVWDAASPYRRWGSPPIGAECDTGESLVPDQRFIALSCQNHGTRVWDTARGELLAELPGVTTVEGDYSSAFPALTANGDRAAIARGNTVEVYALPRGQLLRTIAHRAAVNAVAFAPAGHDLVSGAIDGSLLITRDDRDPLALPRSPAGIDAAAILADGRVVSADASDRLRVIDPDRNALLMDLAAPSRVRLLRPSSDGTRLITISTRSQQAPPALWDLDQYRLITQLDGHVGRVFAARFVSAGHEILTAGSDGTARLWSAATGGPRQTFHGDSHFLADATLAPDGSVVVAGGSDGLLRFWDASNGRLLWTLQAHKSYVVGVHYEGSDIVTRGFTGDVSRWTLPQPDGIIEACHVSTCASAASTRK